VNNEHEHPDEVIATD